jgi:hypothetical protein
MSPGSPEETNDIMAALQSHLSLLFEHRNRVQAKLVEYPIYASSRFPMSFDAAVGPGCSEAYQKTTQLSVISHEAERSGAGTLMIPKYYRLPLTRVAPRVVIPRHETLLLCYWQV